jgi:hypothetical protein
LQHIEMSFLEIVLLLVYSPYGTLAGGLGCTAATSQLRQSTTKKKA